MAYIHNNRRQPLCVADPIDPDSTDWAYFSYQDWLRANETITTHIASIVGGTIVTDSTYVGSMTDSLGVTYTNVYGVKFSVTTGSTQVTITHRVTSTVSGSPDLGRKNIDHSIIIPVVTL